MSVVAKYEGCFCTNVLKEIKEYCIIENIQLSENTVFQFNNLSTTNIVQKVKY